MTRFQATKALLALLVLATDYCRAQSVPRNITVSRQIPYKYPWSVATVNGNSIGGGRFAYITCRPNLQPVGWGTHQRVCQVYLEDFRHRETPMHTSCEVALYTNLDSSFKIVVYDVVPGLEDRVVVAWYVEDQLAIASNSRWIFWRFTQVRMSNCRVSRPIRHNTVMRLLPRAYAVTDDRFLVLAEAIEGGTLVVYGLQLNWDGKLAKEPEPWIYGEEWTGYRLLDVAPVKPPHSGEVVLLVEKTFDYKTSRSAARFTKLNTEKQARLKMGQFNLTSIRDQVVYSTSHGFLTFCLGATSEVNCYHNDWQGRQQFADIVLQTDHEIKDMAVHNLPVGGFLLALGRCPRTSEDSSQPSCETNENTYDIHEFNAQGQKLATTVVPRPKSSDSPFVPASNFYENRQGDYCLMTLCSDPSSNDDVIYRSAFTCLDRER